MNKPKEPRKPTKPTPPLKILPAKSRKIRNYGSITLNQILSDMGASLNDIDLDKAYIYCEFYETDGGGRYGNTIDGDVTIDLGIKGGFENPDYAREMKKYETQLKQYKAKLVTYKEKYIKWAAKNELWEAEDAKKQLKYEKKSLEHTKKQIAKLEKEINSG